MLYEGFPLEEEYQKFLDDLFVKNPADDTLYDTAERKQFAEKMYSLWESLAGNIQEEEPFFMLSYADAPLSWGDEGQTRDVVVPFIAHVISRFAGKGCRK